MEEVEAYVKSTVSNCEKHLVVENLPKFYECVDASLGSGWTKREEVLFTDEGDIVRLLAYRVVGDKVVSILAFYQVDDGEIKYVGVDVDVSDVEDVKRVLGNI